MATRALGDRSARVGPPASELGDRSAGVGTTGRGLRSRIADARARGGRLGARTARLRGRIARLLSNRRTPLVLLGVVCLLGTGARAFHLGIPAATRSGGGYIFDERYYVSAARMIAEKRPTAGDVYAHAAPAGSDPNAEHPQLGKIFIAAGISLFGDNAIGWRITAVVFGAAAILLLYWLVRCAGGGPWMALGAATLASVENLWLVHSRIAVLDIYCIPFMLAGAAFYLRRQPIVAGAVIGIGSCVKEFAVYTVAVLLLLELLRGVRFLWIHRLGRLRPSAIGRAFVPPLTVAVVTGLSYFTLLTALDRLVTPYSGGHPVDRNQASFCNHLLIWDNACNHFVFMNRYAAKLRDVGGHPRGIAAAPSDFWLDRKAIPYYKVTQTVSSGGVVRAHKTILWFRGEIGRVVLFTSWLAIALCAWWGLRRGDRVALLALAWIVGTWLPPELFHVLGDRTTYLYYMVVTMPGLYIGIARLLGSPRLPRIAILFWFGALLWDFAALYPFRTFSGM